MNAAFSIVGMVDDRNVRISCVKICREICWTFLSACLPSWIWTIHSNSNIISRKNTQLLNMILHQKIPWFTKLIVKMQCNQTKTISFFLRIHMNIQKENESRVIWVYSSLFSPIIRTVHMRPCAPSNWLSFQIVLAAMHNDVFAMAITQ